jgi:hypothetical protein
MIWNLEEGISPKDKQWINDANSFLGFNALQPDFREIMTKG